MDKVYFISDLHLGHKKILEFSGDYRCGHTVEEHDNWIVESWNSVVSKRDVVYVLGDIAFTRDGLERCGELKGHKKLICGNHDKFRMGEYERFFRVLPGIFKYKNFWLSHAPIHPCELRGLKNIHGHVHHITNRLFWNLVDKGLIEQGNAQEFFNYGLTRAGQEIKTKDSGLTSISI